MSSLANAIFRKLLLFFFISSVFFFASHNISFAETTPYRSAELVTTDTLISIFNGPFEDLGNCSATDGQTCNRPYGPYYGNLYLRNFGDFGIPEGATITHVRLRVTGKASTPVLAIGAGVSRIGSHLLFFEDCTFPPDLWRMHVLNSSTMQVYNATTPLTNGILAHCLSYLNIKTGNFVFRVNFSNSNPWSANIDNFEIAFDYTPAEAPTPTPTPTPPEPFLDLPWDYEEKGLPFTEAALNINSFFDHEYPLLSAPALGEPSETNNSVIKYIGPPRSTEKYSRHDGYDYGRLAKAEFGDPVKAAASGIATYVNTCGDCGNAILIDHGNGYQTRYYHLQEEELITNIPGQEIEVNSGDQIGKVGSTGKSTGAHIHFMVVQDKNNDEDFEDNIPDGLVDPFGWQSEEPDPWESYGKSNEFFYNGEYRTGNKSYYLWKKQIDSLDATLTANGGVFTSGRNTVTIPEGATDQNLLLEMISSPVQKITDFIVSIGSSVDIKAYDPLGVNITSFNTPFSVGIDFSGYDLSKYLLDTLSIYSSGDGINWQKEETEIDLINQKATTEVDHLTYFALMAERIDTIPATTTSVLNGEEGEDNWFRSNVTVELVAEDNPGGLGVDYILYKTDGGDWQEYTDPLEFSDEGEHIVEFYSVDNDENIEDVKSISLIIDKTPPIASISANPSILWPPSGKSIPVTIWGSIEESNFLTKSFLIIDEYNEEMPTINDFGDTVLLKAKRKGSDKDGRVYIIKVEAVDLAGNISSASAEVVVPHDQGEE